MRIPLAALAALSLAACSGHLAPGYTPPPLPASAADRMQHASMAGTIAALRRPTRRQFIDGTGLGMILGPLGTIIAYAGADADPPDVPITPVPVYADTSAAYVLAFRQAYDAQVRSDRRGAALGGGLLGMLISGVAVYALINNQR